jgi:hypothetical protein
VFPSMKKGEIIGKLVVIDVNPRRMSTLSEALLLFEEKEYEGNCKCMQNPHRWIVLFILFPMVGGMSWFLMLKSYSLLKMKPQSMVKKPLNGCNKKLQVNPKN